ncbi:hypothetical protein ACKVV7_001508 [Pyricularia oryzae]
MPSLPATAISITTEYADSTSSQGVLFVPPSSNASSNATRKYKGSGREAFCVPMTGAMLMEQEQMVVAWDRNPDL